jgi:choline dehydrogenase-like flavoprotein
MDILVKGIKLVRRIGESSPLKSTLTKEITPGSDVQTDDDWIDWLRQSASTEFHPSSSCAMLPHDQGGVVDANLRVYGLANVRVADSSVAPIALSTHLMSSTYAIAEQASSIILATYNSTSTSPSTVPHLSASSSTVAPGNTLAPTGTRTSAASNCRQSPAALWHLGAILAVVISFLF